MRVRAFAKINLSLRVLGVRADGYHELRTIFQSIALHDTLTIRTSRGPFHFTCDDPNCPSDDTNLVWRAARQVWKAAGRRGAPCDVRVSLAKKVPVQAGLGGGSSDGAAALRAFGRLWRVDATRLREIGRSLGADVPYFFEGGTALGLDRGDRLFPLIDAKKAWVALVLPAFGVSTKDAYEWFDEVHAGAELAPPRDDGPRTLGPDDQGNDLQTAVALRHPEIGRIVVGLRRAGASQAAMSGSGSAVFGLFSRRPDALRAAAIVATKARRTIVTRTVDRTAYQALAAC